jgi:carbon-monoxide dehydrogenase large subunit
MSSTESTTDSWVGTSMRRREDRRLVLGAGRFAADVSVPGQVHCALVRSPHPHARIRAVDASVARAMPGVVTVVTGKQALEHWRPLPQMTHAPGAKYPGAHALAHDKVVFQGEAVAAVAAEDPYIAEDAIQAVRVEYEVLPPVVGIDAALGDGSTAPTLLYDWEDNLQVNSRFEIGDVDDAFAAADEIVKHRLTVQRHGGVPLEPRAALAQYEPVSRQVILRLSTQIPHQCRSVLSEIFGFPESNIRVISEDVGGAYGNKAQIDAEAVVVLLAMLTGRPAKWVETRTEWMMTGPASRDYRVDVEAAFRSDGRLLAIRQRLVGNVGCDGGTRASGFPSLMVGGNYVPGPYDVQSYASRVQAVVTNKGPYGGYRGYGKDAANGAIERAMDMAARRLGLDRVEIRRRNLIAEYPYQMCTGPIVESGSLIACLDAVAEEMDIPALEERQRRERENGRQLGIGIVSFIEPSGASIPGSYFNGYQSATVRMAPDGSVTVLTGIQNTGQSVETPVAQVAAQTLGCHPDRIMVVSGDTGSVPYGLGSFSSRGSTYGLNAVHTAAVKVREKLVKAAALMLEADALDIEVADGAAFVRGAPQRRLTLDELARAVYITPGPYLTLPDEPDPGLEASSTWTSPDVRWTPDEHGRMRIYPEHSCGAAGALVEVDPETGQVRVEQVWLAHDVGKQVNPAIVEGQLIGSVVQGFGGVMMEELAYDDSGTMLARTLGDYQMPNFLSVPPVVPIHLETPSPGTPLGTKGAGEPGCISTGSLLMAAVENALEPFAVQVTTAPLTQANVLALIEAARAGGEPS